MTEKFTDEELEGMTEEEVKAITMEDETPVEEEEDTEDTKDEKEEDVEPEEKEPETAEIEEEAEVGDSVEDKEEGDNTDVEEESVEDVEETKPARPREPSFVAPTFEAGKSVDYSYDQIKQAIVALDKQYDNAEIESLTEYNEKRDILKRIEYEKLVDDRQEQLVEKMNSQMQTKLWEQQQEFFFSEGDNDKFRTDPVLYSALDGMVKNLANSDEYRNASGISILMAAKKEVDKRFNATDMSSDEDTVGQTQSKKIVNIKRPGKGKAPKTLADIPAAQENVTKTAGLSALDSLSGEKFEQALGKLTEEQQLEYLTKTGSL